MNYFKMKTEVENVAGLSYDVERSLKAMGELSGKATESGFFPTPEGSVNKSLYEKEKQALIMNLKFYINKLNEAA